MISNWLLIHYDLQLTTEFYDFNLLNKHWHASFISLSDPIVQLDDVILTYMYTIVRVQGDKESHWSHKQVRWNYPFNLNLQWPIENAIERWPLLISIGPDSLEKELIK